MSKRILAGVMVVLLILTSYCVVAETADEQAPYITIELKDGSILEGYVIGSDKDSITIKLRLGGEVTIYRHSIAAEGKNPEATVPYSNPVQSTTATSPNDYLQGQLDGKAAATGHAGWIVAGLGCGVFGVGFAFIHKPQPSVYTLMGKPSTYCAAYIDAYGTASRNKNVLYSLAGWAAWMVFLIAVYAGSDSY